MYSEFKKIFSKVVPETHQYRLPTQILPTECFALTYIHTQSHTHIFALQLNRHIHSYPACREAVCFNRKIPLLRAGYN